MKGKQLFTFFILFFFGVVGYAQEEFKSEDDLKQKAAALFAENKLIEASPLYAQLLSLYPQDPEYNFKYGACLLATEADKQKPIKYLSFAISKGADPLASYYLGRAYHLNYNFAKAVKAYSRFKNKASSDQKVKYQIERQIEMCKNGNKLLSRLNEVQVVDRKVIAAKDFFRVYDLEGIDGKIISKPEDFKSKYDKKRGEKSIIFLPNNTKELYYSSYGKKGETGRDIYKVIKLGEDSWSEPVKLGEGINTPYDEEYPYVLPDGRTMYFASKGHSSMGGYDLFKSTYDQSAGAWTEPENLDFAFSSADDDIMFVTDASNQLAYFASNRSNVAGKFTVYKVLVEKKPAEVAVIKGKFIAENALGLTKAKVTVIDKATNETVGVYETDKEGNYSIEIAENGGSYQFSLETTDDAPIHTGVVNIPKQDEFSIFGQELRLVGEGDDQQLVIKNIFDGTMEANLRSTGPQVSSELLRKKANLDVNFDASNLSQLVANNDTPDKESTDVTEPSTSNVGSTSTNSNTNKTESNLSGSTSFSAEQQRVAENLSRSTSQAKEKVASKEESINATYSNAIALQKEAEKLFQEKEQLIANGANEEEIESKEEEAKKKALEAGIATQLAMKLEESVKTDQGILSSINTKEGSVQTAITGNDLASAELALNEIILEEKRIASPTTILQNEKDKIAENKRENQEEIQSNEIKKQSLDSEQLRIEKQISDLVTELENANETEQATISQQIDQLSIDLEDIAYQQFSNTETSKKIIAEGNIISVQEKQLDEALAQLANSSAGSAAGVEEISEADKEALINQMKTYRDNDQMAYTNQIELDAQAFDQQSFDNSNKGTLSTEFSTTSPLVRGINSTYEKELASVASNVDPDLRSAQQLRVYDDWVDELENNLVQKEASLSELTDTEDQATTRNDIEELQNQIDLVSAKRDNLEDQVAQNNVTADNTSSTVSASQSNASPSTANESGSNNSSAVEESFTNNEQALSSVDGTVNQTSNSIESNGSGNTNTVSNSANNSEDRVSTVADVSEINDQSIVDDSFTNFDFRQDASDANAQPNQEMLLAKRTLFEASKIAEEAEAARQAAYSLPTVEERTAAFEKANRLKKESELKQLEAAAYFADYNKKEYQINQSRIDNANQYEEEFESSNLDIANLLAEEAEVYFNNATELRASIDPNSRYSVQETELQKAYDYEILALNKQQEALQKLNLASKDYFNPQAAVPQEEFVQTITDENALAITDENIARAIGDSLSKTVSSLKQQAVIKRSEAENIAVGNQRDSVLALAENFDREAEQNNNKAAVYYQRAEQLKSGVEQAASNKLLASIVRPAIVNSSQEQNTIAIDTVDINDERKNLVLNSQAFVQYAKSLQDRDRLAKEAEIEYNNAIRLAELNQQLKKQARVERSNAQAATTEEERQRLIKSAEVIDQKALATETSIDSINKIIKIKNYLITSSEQKMLSSLANLSEVEQNEIIQLSKNYEGELATVDNAAIDSGSTATSNDNNELISEEASQTADELAAQSIDGVNVSEIPVVDEGVNNEGGLIDQSRPQTSNDGEEFSYSGENSNSGSGGTTPSAVTASNQTNSRSGSETTSPTREAAATNDLNNTANGNSTTSGVNTVNSLATINNIPRQVKQAIFITLEKEESVYDVSNPIPLDVEMPEGLVYKVQIGAFRNPIPQNLFKGFAPLAAETAPGGITRYTAGFFVTEKTAIEARNQIRGIGYPDAFVVAFLNGKRISLSQARENSGEPKPLDDAPAIVSNGNVTKVEGGSKEGLGVRFSAPQLEEVVNVATIEGVYFTVQIGVYSKPVEKGTFSSYSELNVIELPSGLIRYNTGIFRNALDAADRKITVQTDIADAFVTAYNNGKRISLNEASRLKNK